MGRGFRSSTSRSPSVFFGGFPATGSPSSAGSGGWNCFRQNSRGVSAEGLAGSGAARAKLTDLLEVPVPKKHSDIRKLLLCCTLGLVSLIGSPCTASISALLTNAQTSTFFPELASSGTFALFCSELPGAWLAGSEAVEKRKPQSKMLMVGLWLMASFSLQKSLQTNVASTLGPGVAISSSGVGPAPQDRRYRCPRLWRGK